MPNLNNRRWRFHGLKKPKVRQDMNKYNLYNLSRIGAPNTASRTYFQQKWTAKASTRAYHGEVIREQQWERMFSRTANAVVPMDPAYLAEHDGSEHAAGRGSGLEPNPTERPKRMPQPTPYMQMAYHPTERRLDTAIFRALFASSTRQARQFVVHGHVKVNGKKMIHPGYLLNPGDMFQVEPERVLFGIGAWKGSTLEERYFDFLPPAEAAAARENTYGPPRVLRSNEDTEADKERAQNEDAEAEVEEGESTASLEEDLADLELDDVDITADDATLSSSDPLAATMKQLQSLRKRAKELIANPPRGIRVTANRKVELRALSKELKTHVSRAASVTPSTLDDLEMQLQGIVDRVEQYSKSSSHARDSVSSLPSSSIVPPPPPPPLQTHSSSTDPTSLLPPEKQVLPLPTVTNTKDKAKPYATPWRPRDFMPAFAFIPRYLEVNQNVCSAVYLRHPVCKPGLAEVPTPFHPETMQLAFNYYLRRR